MSAIAPLTVGSEVIAAMIVAVPFARARISPAVGSTIATLVSLDAHRTAMISAVSHDLVIWCARSVSPGCSVAEGGDTEGPSNEQSLGDEAVSARTVSVGRQAAVIIAPARIARSLI